MRVIFKVLMKAIFKPYWSVKCLLAISWKWLYNLNVFFTCISRFSKIKITKRSISLHICPYLKKNREDEQFF